MRRRRAAALVALATATLASCGVSPEDSMPSCEPGPRLGILAQSVPSAAYVPCVDQLATGWSFEGLDVDDHGATLSLESDRSDRGVEVRLRRSCDVTDAVPITPSDEGVRTYHLVRSIEPRVAGRIIDVFPGGCVEADYDFERGPHVALVTQLQAATGLFTRLELRQALRADLGITLDP